MCFTYEYILNIYIKYPTECFENTQLSIKYQDEYYFNECFIKVFLFHCV